MERRWLVKILFHPTQAWEILPYCKLAAEFGYRVLLLEPDTPWKHNSNLLSYKTSHGVPYEKIIRLQSCR